MFSFLIIGTLVFIDIFISPHRMLGTTKRNRATSKYTRIKITVWFSLSDSYPLCRRIVKFTSPYSICTVVNHLPTLDKGSYQSWLILSVLPWIVASIVKCLSTFSCLKLEAECWSSTSLHPSRIHCSLFSYIKINVLSSISCLFQSSAIHILEVHTMIV